jgi:hypothetical protein
MHGQAVANDFFLQFFEDVEDGKGGRLAAVFELADISRADTEPAGQFGLGNT